MKTANIPTELLRSFIAVVDLGSVTGAGEVLGRSQPAVSLQLKRLEGLLGKAILERDGQLLRLNRDGRILYDYAQRILALNDELYASFQGLNISGTVRFGIPSEFATAILPRIIGRFSRSYPEVTLEVTSGLSTHLMQGYRQHEFDLILALHDEPARKDRPRQGHVRNDELVWVGNLDDAQQGAGLPLVLAPEGCIYRKRALARLRKQRMASAIVYTNPDLGGIAAAIEEGLGVSALARSTVPKGVPVLKAGSGLPELGSIGVSLLYRAGERNPAVERLEEEIRASLN